MKGKVVIFVPAFVLAILIQLLLEHLNMVDSLGLWYTLICAVVYSVPLFALGVLVLKIIKSKG